MPCVMERYAMSKLTVSEIFKYERRINLFLQKYTTGDSFLLRDGSLVELTFDPEIAKHIENRDSIPLRSAKLHGTNGDIYRFGDLAKSKEFGGKGSGSGTIKEDLALSSLRESLWKVKTANSTSDIPIMIGETKYLVSDIVSTPGTPKSDFHLIDRDGQEVAWLSHKDGNSPKHVQQWGGVTQSRIKNHPEVQDFIDCIKSLFENSIPRRTTIARPVTCETLKMMSVYGIDYGKSPNFGQNNVNMVLQGPVSLVEVGDVFHIHAPHHYYNGDKVVGEYEPTLMAAYKGDRSQFGIKGARITIQPLMSRKINDFI